MYRQHLFMWHLSISGISQFVLSCFWPNFKSKCLGPSLTYASCHGDIFSSNPGDICTYHKYLTFYLPNQTKPNLPNQTYQILQTKLIFWTNIFFSDQNIFQTKFYFRAKIFFGQIFFRTKKFFGSKFFIRPKFFSD